LDADLQNDFLAEIETEADRLGMLIADLLENAESLSGIAPRRRTTVAPARLVASSLNRVRRDLDGRQLDLDIPDDLPSLEVDLHSVEHVLGNLLHNAHKYSPVGAPIHVSVCARDGMVELRIDDHGSGVPVDERKHVFEPFYRASSASDVPVPGQGLGLAICRSIVMAHHGQIWVEDSPTGGARFTVSLPAKAHPAGPAPVKPAQSADKCAYCGASQVTRSARVFTLQRPRGSWRLCQRCWRFLQAGFRAHRPGEDLEERLAGTVPVNSAEVRGWIKTGLKQVGTESVYSTQQGLR
jgi:hypothetical protein